MEKIKKEIEIRLLANKEGSWQKNEGKINKEKTDQMEVKIKVKKWGRGKKYKGCK